MLRAILAVLVVAASAGVAPAVARQEPLPLREVASGSIGPLHAAGSDAVAWTSADGRVVVRHDDGRRVDVSVPAGCEGAGWDDGLVAAGAGRLLFSCRPGPAGGFAFVVTALDGTDAVRLEVPYPESTGAASLLSTTIGGRWIAQRFTGNHEMIRRYVRWRTGEIRTAVGWEFAPSDESATFEDLGALQPRRLLCNPIAGPDLQVYTWPTLFVSLPSSPSRRLTAGPCGSSAAAAVAPS